MHMIRNRQKVLTLIIAIFAISMLFIATVTNANAAEVVVTRTLSTTNPVSDSTFEVRLDLTGLQIGGVIETISPDFVFVSTQHPQEQTNVSSSGQELAFVVVNETVIVYVVRAPSEGIDGTISGMWYDALSMTKGDIGSTSVSVNAVQTPTPSPATPDFNLVSTLAGLLAVVYILARCRKGHGGDGQ